jgi:hypothetical protein
MSRSATAETRASSMLTISCAPVPGIDGEGYGALGEPSLGAGMTASRLCLSGVAQLRFDHAAS